MSIELAQRLLELQPLVSPITLTDYPLYRSFFQRHARPKSYSHSWIYITQACRGFGLGLKYHDHERLYSIGCHRDHFVIVCPVGPLDNILVDLVKCLKNVSSKPVFLKKISPDQSKTMLDYEDFAVVTSRTDAYIWHETEYADDDTYPELICSPDIILGYSTKSEDWEKRFKHRRVSPLSSQDLKSLKAWRRMFRRQVKKFKNSGVVIEIRPMRAEDEGAVRNFTESYFQDLSLEKSDAYRNMIDIPQGEMVSRFLVWHQNHPSVIAFCAVEQVNKDAVSLVALLADRQYVGLEDMVYIELMHIFQQQGIEYINLGGSETESLHKHKRRLSPIEEYYMTMMIYGQD